ncbi:MAG: beta-mannanase [Synergistaceae bacterium]|nr:beta-mannanase [Synergistaceae bacterium]
MAVRVVFAVFLLFSTFLPGFSAGQLFGAVKAGPPGTSVYHSAHPDFGAADDLVTPESVRSFAALSGKKIAWAFVSFHWGGDMRFPSEACRVLHREGVVPLIGMMPWSELRQNSAESRYTMERIASGDFDDGLRRCAEDVRALGFPIMIEFGPEANGSWFPWNGAWNGRNEDTYGERGCPDGPERFRDAYRRVVRIFRESGALDVTWVFHIASDGYPKEAWNSARFYYPGDEWVDWIGASVYGRLRGDGPAVPFDRIMSKIYPGLTALSPEKPIAILELGVSESGIRQDKSDWIKDALESVSSGRYPRLRAVGWWNKKFRPDGSRSTLEIDSSPESLAAYRDGVKNFVTEILWTGLGTRNARPSCEYRQSADENPDELAR